jgi:hypothetical protein
LSRGTIGESQGPQTIVAFAHDLPESGLQYRTPVSSRSTNTSSGVASVVLAQKSSLRSWRGWWQLNALPELQ